VHRAVIAGDAESGVTIMRVVKALDAGPMLSRVVVPIGPDDTTAILEAQLAIRGAQLLVETLDAIESGRATETPQDESLVTYAPKLTKIEGVVDWRRSATEIHNLIRGLWPWPHAYSFLDGTRFILHRSRLSPHAAGGAPGTIVMASALEGLHVACGDGRALEIVDLQLEGKRVMSARDAMTNRLLAPGSRFTAP
jgi:methionyl-tRNA formyltransferase